MLRGLGARGSGASAGDVLRLIRTGTATTPAELGRVTGLSRGALDSRLEHLLSRGLVVVEAAPVVQEAGVECLGWAVLECSIWGVETPTGATISRYQCRRAIF